MDRTDDILIPPQTSWLTDPQAQRVCALVEDAGHRIYFVGGCVRDALLGWPSGDVDLSTDAHPERVMELAQAAGLQAIPTGLAHGTVTVVSDGKPFEVTTFRRDVETDGRRAVVAFSDRIEDDARRRDFTMNALYADRAGRVIDPLGGLPDLLARRVVFIEDATARIREDYLRVLRYFRFHAWYADAQAGHDPDVLHAIAVNLEGLATLSAERVGQEMRKLLAAPDPAGVLAVMRQSGVLGVILPGADDRFLGPFVHNEGLLMLSPEWLGRLAAIGGDDVADRLRLSKAETMALEQIRASAFGTETLPAIAYRQGLQVARQSLLLRQTFFDSPADPTQLELLNAAAAATFPVRAADLMPAYQGPDLGRKLAALEKSWIDSGFALTREDLLAER